MFFPVVILWQIVIKTDITIMVCLPPHDLESRVQKSRSKIKDQIFLLIIHWVPKQTKMSQLFEKRDKILAVACCSLKSHSGLVTVVQFLASEK